MINMKRVTGWAIFLLLFGSATAQQPMPTELWTVATSKDYDKLPVGTQLRLKLIDDGRFKLDVKNSLFHEIQRARFERRPMCRIYVDDAAELNDRNDMIRRFDEAQVESNCPNSADRDNYFTAITKISGHKHAGEEDHDHMVVLLRTCVRVGADNCASTHFVMLLLNAVSSWKSGVIPKEAKKHNGLIHGPQ